MKIYLAGTTVSNPEQELVIQSIFRVGCKLHSYYHCQEGGFENKWFEVNMKNKVDLFLDSGAFSAFTQGVNIDIQQYISFIKEHEDVLTVYANLDVIGDGKATWQNQKIMEEAGLNPLPVFHLDEWQENGAYYLEKCMEYPYFCIGGIARGGMRGTRESFLKGCFDIICDTPDRKPRHKVHGFGLTSLKLMLQYPWYSVDSTSWVVTGRMGSIYVPRFWGGQYLYDKDSWKITVSARSPGMSDDPDHIDNMKHKRPRVHQQILDYIHSKGYNLGKSSFKKEHQDYQLADNEKWAQKRPENKTDKRLVEVLEEEGLCNKYQLRDELNIIYFLDLEKSMPEWPWAFEHSGPVKKGGLGLL